MSTLNQYLAVLSIALLLHSSSGVCLPTRMPTETPEQRTSACSGAGVWASERNDVIRAGLQTIKTAMNKSKNAVPSNSNSLGFYSGSEDLHNIAFGVTFLKCAVPHVVDIMAHEAHNPVMGDEVSVSGWFHAVYDVLDPENSSSLINNLEALVQAKAINECSIPRSHGNCMPVILESTEYPLFVLKVATSLCNLSMDLDTKMNELQ